jgi:hypothetical protein
MFAGIYISRIRPGMILVAPTEPEPAALAEAP